MTKALKLLLLPLMVAMMASTATAKLSGGEETSATQAAHTASDTSIATPDEQVDAEAEAQAEALLEKKLRNVIAHKRLIEHEQTETAPLVCRTEKQLGSRIKKHRCLTMAQWRDEYELRLFKSYVMKPAARRGWLVSDGF